MSSIETAAVSRQSDAWVLGPWYVVEFLNSYAVTLVLACVPYFIKTGALQGTVGDSLWQSAAWGSMYVPYALLAGKWADKWGPRRLLVRAALLAAPMALTGLLAVRWPNLWILFVALTVFNFANTMCWPALESAVARSPGRVRLSSRMSIYNLTWSSGGFLAFATADWVMGPAEARHWAAVFVVPACVSLIGALVAVFATIPQAMLVSEQNHHGESDQTQMEVSPVRGKALLLMAWIGNTMAYVAGNVLIAVMPRISIEKASMGSIWTFARIAGFAAWFAWAGWQYKVRYLVGAYMLLVVSFFAALFMADPVAGTPKGMLIPAEIGFGLAASFIYASSLYYAMHVSSGGGSHAGMHEALIGLGIGTGCAVGALAMGAGGGTLAPVAISVSGILAAGGVAIVIVALRCRRRRSE